MYFCQNTFILNKAKLIQNLAQLLKETPTSRDIVITDEKINERYAYLAKHMIDKAIEHNALLYSDDYASIGILFERKKNEKASFWKNLISDIALAWHVTGIKKGLAALKVQQKIKASYPKDTDYLYCWFLGVVPDERGVTDKMLAYKMKDRFFEISKQKKLPIYAETRTKRIAIAYMRYGFKLQDKWQHPNGGEMFFLRYDPED